MARLRHSLHVGAGGLDGAADAAEQVQLPAGLQRVVGEVELQRRARRASSGKRFRSRMIDRSASWTPAEP